MTITLTKGGNVSLTKVAPDLRFIRVGLGWDLPRATATGCDLDASALALGADGQVVSDQHFVFFNNLRSPDGAISHLGDNLTGGGDGDDEQIAVDLAAVPEEVVGIVFAVSIYEAEQRAQTFGRVQNAFIRIVDSVSGRELARYDLTEDASSETALVFGEVHRSGGEWQFRAIGQGFADGLRAIALAYGVSV